jgi:hypothetical protein
MYFEDKIKDCKLLIWAMINENMNKNMILNVNDQNISLKFMINK